MDAKDFRVTRVKGTGNASQGSLALLGETVRLAQEHVPKLRASAQNRIEFRNMEDSMSQLGAYCRANGFDPTRSFQHVANLDTEIWALILKMFAKEDDDGNMMDDGLLYKTDPRTNALALNKEFFYALIGYLESCGVPCDMRGKIKVN
jgi:hypothetical protein